MITHARGILYAMVLSLSVATSSFAQQASGDKAAAEALFVEGKRLLQESKFSEACAKLAESQRLDPAVGTLLHLGECYHHSGKTASAWAVFRSAESMARNARQPEREKVAQERAAELEKILSRLTIVVSSKEPAPGLEIRRDGVVLGSASWGTAIPVDPGLHLIEATAPGKKRWSKSVTVGAQGASESVTIGELESAELTPASSSPPPTTPSSGPPPQQDMLPPAVDHPPNRTGRGDTQRVLGLVIGSIGIVGIGVGSYFGLQAMSKDKKARDNCHEPPDDGTNCTAEGLAFNDEAKDANTAAAVGFAVGGAALVGGLVLYLTAPRDSATAHPSPRGRSWQLSPIANSTVRGFQVQGAW